jgi:hypothetical protein
MLAMKKILIVTSVLACLLATTSARAGNVFLDTFDTDNNPNGDGWYDVNHQYALRQSGSLAPRTYLEDSSTANGGGSPYLTQVNNPGLRNTLLLAAFPGAGHNFTWVSPNQDFLGAGPKQHLHVEIDPLGPGSSSSTDHWAALVFGTTPGSFIIGNGTGVLVRDSGEYELWNNGHLDSTGNVGAKTSPTQFYAIDFDVNMTTGAYSLAIDGKHIFSGSHGAYSTNYVTLEDYSGNGSLQVDYLDNLSVAAPEPATMTLAVVGAAGLLWCGWRRKRRAPSP